MTVLVDEKKVAVDVLERTLAGQSGIIVRAGGRVFRVVAEKPRDSDAYSVELNERPLSVRVEDDTSASLAASSEAVEGPVVVTSPMAGKIASVKVITGAAVEQGQALVVLEAMKMENEIAAPKKGTVREVYVQQGALARTGDKLLLIE